MGETKVKTLVDKDGNVVESHLGHETLVERLKFHLYHCASEESEESVFDKMWTEAQANTGRAVSEGTEETGKGAAGFLFA